MSELATLARPYAEAVFKRAKETETSEKWSDNLAFIATVLENELISEAADNPKFGKDNFLKLMLDICQGQIDQEGENFIKLLVENNRLKLAKYIADIYEQFRAEDEGYSDVRVSSAYSLTSDEQKKLTSTLKKVLNKEIHLTVVEDRSLIGGILIRAGDRVIDGSIKGQLQQLAKRL